MNDDYIYYLNQSYILKCDDSISNEIVNILKDSIFIESVYIEPEVEVCAIPDYSGTQIYLDTESGLNVREAWNYSTGQNVKVGLIEFGFNKNHIELSNVNIGVDFPNNWDSVSHTNHGTASLGVVGSLNNGFGTTGIAYNSNIWFSSIYNGVANALLYLISNCGFAAGDVISMSISYGSAGTIEYDITTYNAIKYATLLGITVCISAGNDSLNLENLSTYNNNPLSNPNLPQNDSGSIVVGGGTTTRSAFSYSNYGERVNVQGLGTSVVTSGYGDLYSIDGENSYYTKSFGGTSSACPTVAGGVALIQSYRKSLGLQPFNAYEIRNLFELINYPQTGDLTRHIGGMPNICGIITSVGMSNISPIATNDTVELLENGSCNINVLQNDNDTDGNVVELIKATHGQYGSTEINLDKTIKYTPNSNYAGSDSFKYLISDDNIGVSIGTVNVTVVPANSIPIAVNDSITTHKNIPVDILVLSNDTDADGDTLILLSVTQGINGTTSINPNNSVKYIPNTNYVGQDTFEYTISDGNGGTDTAIVTINVINTPPVALNNSANTTLNIPIDINVLTNDSDFNNDPLIVIGVTQGLHGDVIINQNQTIKYSPHNNYLGIDTFSYTISDGSGGTSSANVTVNIGSQTNNNGNSELEGNNNQIEEGEIIMAKKYVQERQLKTGSTTEYRQMYDSQRASTNFVIAPADAINKEGADLILGGTDGAADTLAINNAFIALDTARGEDTDVPIRVDFLGGTIDNIEQINIPDNFYLYGNGVTINQVDFAERDMSNNNYVLKGTDKIYLDRFITKSFINTDINYLEPNGISIITGNVSNCTVIYDSDILGGDNKGISIITGDVLNCTVSGAYNKGISIITGDVLNCTVSGSYFEIFIITGDALNCTVSGHNGIYITTGNVSNCNVNCSESGIHIDTGSASECIVGDSIYDCISINTGSVSNCTVGDSDYGIMIDTGSASYCIVGSCNIGINILTGDVSNCIVGNCVTGIYMMGEGNVLYCKIGDCSSGGIYIAVGNNNIISGNKIIGLTFSNSMGITVEGDNCIITNNNLITKTGSDTTYISINGTGTSARNNQLGTTFVVEGVQ